MDCTKLTLYDYEIERRNRARRRDHVRNVCIAVGAIVILAILIVMCTGCSAFGPPGSSSLELQLPSGEILRSQRWLWTTSLEAVYEATTTRDDGSTTTVHLDIDHTGRGNDAITALKEAAKLGATYAAGAAKTP